MSCLETKPIHVYKCGLTYVGGGGGDSCMYFVVRHKMLDVISSFICVNAIILLIFFLYVTYDIDPDSYDAYTKSSLRFSQSDTICKPKVTLKLVFFKNRLSLKTGIYTMGKFLPFNIEILTEEIKKFTLLYHPKLRLEILFNLENHLLSNQICSRLIGCGF